MARGDHAGPVPGTPPHTVGAPPSAPRSDIARGLLIAGHLALAGLLAAAVLGLLYVVASALGYISVHMPPQVQDWDTALYRSINHLQDPGVTKWILALLNDPGIDYTLMIAPCLGYLWARRRREG